MTRAGARARLELTRDPPAMPDSSPVLPRGFQVAGVHCGIKADATREDLAVIVCQADAVAAGVYTQNRIFAAPVALDRERTPAANIRAVVVNSGNANACTGRRGDEDAAAMCRAVAEACGAEESQALVMSTGVIGEPLPQAKVLAGISAAAAQLGDDDVALQAAARAFMTTDTVPKLAARTVEGSDGPVRLTAIAKGAAMIGPNMATMLALVMTDACLAPEVAQRRLAEAVAETFNCIRVDGHTSTNDTVLLLASGQAESTPRSGASPEAFAAALREVCEELALAIVADGEGTTHVVEILVRGCRTPDEAREIARAVGDSPLVKTAIAGADPNWGRIVSAAGYAGVSFDPAQLELELNSVPLYRHGEPLPFDAAAVSQSIRQQRDVQIVLRLGEGDAEARLWTTDLTTEYVRLNAEYHT